MGDGRARRASATVQNAYRRRGRDFYDWCIISAWADAERLAGGEA
jgi:hypothetical protein